MLTTRDNRLNSTLSNLHTDERGAYITIATYKRQYSIVQLIIHTHQHNAVIIRSNRLDETIRMDGHTISLSTNIKMLLKNLFVLNTLNWSAYIVNHFLPIATIVKLQTVWIRMRRRVNRRLIRIQAI